MIDTIQIKRFRCNQCGHSWLPCAGRRADESYTPRRCSNRKCKSWMWNEPRVESREIGRPLGRKDKGPRARRTARALTTQTLGPKGQAAFDEMIARRKRLGVPVTKEVIDEAYQVARLEDAA